ncbi:MAG: hypothetical protein NVS2B14_02680 [Chamaesiphon sp.]
MERSNTALLNGRKATGGDEELTQDMRSNRVVTQPEVTETKVEDDLKTRSPKAPEVEKEVITPSPEAPRKKKPKVLLLAGLAVVASVAGIFGYRWWQFTSTHEGTDTIAQVLVNDNQLVRNGQLLVKLDPSDYQVKVQQAQAAIETAKRQAQAAQANIALASQTAQGITTQAQGDVRGAQSAIASAQAAVVQAQSGMPSAQAGVREAQAGISVAQAQLAQANATLVRTQTDYKRYDTLYRQGAVARQQRDTALAGYQVALAQKNAAAQGVQQAQAKLAQAEAGVNTVQAAVAQAQQGVTTAQAKLASSQGGLQQAGAKNQQTQVNRSQYSAALAAIGQSQAALKDAQLQLSYTNITAPTNGRVGNKSVEIGQRVQPGQPLMAIVGNDLWVVANFKETQMGKIHPGQPVEITLDTFPKHPFQGRVESISPASGADFALLPPDNATGNFTKVVQRIPVKVDFDPQSIKGYELRITPGMSTNVSVNVK